MHQGQERVVYQGGRPYQGVHQVTATQRFAGERIVSSGEKPALVRMQPHSFDLKIEINLGPPHVYISEKALLDMSCIVSEATMGEVGWVGTVRRDRMNFYIDEIFLPEQRGHTATCEITTEGLGNLTVEILKRPDGMEVWNSIRFWGHVHPGNDTGPSGQDNDQMKIFADACPDFFVRGILGRSGRMEFTIFLYDIGVIFYDVEWSIKEEDAELAKRRETWRDLLAKFVKPIVHAVAGRKGGGRKGGKGGKRRGHVILVSDDEGTPIDYAAGGDDKAGDAQDQEDQRTATDEVPDESDPGAGAHFDPDAETSDEMDQEMLTATFQNLVAESEKSSALRVVKWVNDVDVPPKDDIDPREYGNDKLRTRLEERSCPTHVDDEFIIRRNELRVEGLVSKAVRSAVRGGPCIDVEDSTAHFDCLDSLEKLADRALALRDEDVEEQAQTLKAGILADLRELLERRGHDDLITDLVLAGHFQRTPSESASESDNATSPAESAIDEVAAT